MTDVVDSKTRSRMMSGIRGKNTKPEIIVRKCLFSLGCRYRLHRRALPGAPDIVMPGRKIVVFVHGCFWHSHQSCRLVKTPASNVEFWRNKLSGTVVRDEKAASELQAMGWRVLVVWECSTRGKAEEGLSLAISKWLSGHAKFGEIPENSHLRS
jgi:DNA mismatch endonuclease, patch repair protein